MLPIGFRAAFLSYYFFEKKQSTRKENKTQKIALNSVVINDIMSYDIFIKT